jgi:hypothetical protein
MNYACVKNKIIENILVFDEASPEVIQQIKETFFYDELVECPIEFLINVEDIYHNGHFLKPRPYPSWELGEDSWLPPTPMPEQDPENPVLYTWNEETLSWEELNGN